MSNSSASSPADDPSEEVVEALVPSAGSVLRDAEEIVCELGEIVRLLRLHRRVASASADLW